MLRCVGFVVSSGLDASEVLPFAPGWFASHGLQSPPPCPYHPPLTSLQAMKRETMCVKKATGRVRRPGEEAPRFRRGVERAPSKPVPHPGTLFPLDAGLGARSSTA